MSDLKVELTSQGTDGVYEQLYKQLLKQRIIYLNGEIDDALVDTLTVPILLKNMEEISIKDDELKPITIWMNSEGGIIDAAIHAVEIIQQSRIPIHVRVLSCACSAALIITMVCKKRMANKNSKFLLHDGEYFVVNSGSKVIDTFNYFKQLQDKVDKIVLKYSKFTEDEYEKIKRNELFFYGEEALKLGFIDELV